METSPQKSKDGFDRFLGAIVRTSRWMRPRLHAWLHKDRSMFAVAGVLGVGMAATLAFSGFSFGGKSRTGRIVGCAIGVSLGLLIVAWLARSEFKAWRVRRAQGDNPETATPAHLRVDDRGQVFAADVTTRGGPPGSHIGPPRERTPQDIGASAFGFLLLMLATLMCWLQAGPVAVLWLPSWAQILCLMLWGVVAGHSMLSLATSTARSNLRASVNRITDLGNLVVMGFAVALAAVVTGWFATLTGALANAGIVRFDCDVRATPGNLVGFYIYQAFDFATIADVFPRWRHLEHHSSGIGLLSFVFRIWVLAALIELWRARRTVNPVAGDTRPNATALDNIRI